MHEASRSDLDVDVISDALRGRVLDVIVSGSIGAVESVRFIRALRRLGAEVIPWLTAGGARFVTDVALAWAAGRPTRTDFAGEASHIATGDACVVAPMSANFVSHVACGQTDTPGTALVASYLGMGRPVYVVPNMHASLAQAPMVERYLEALGGMGVVTLASREEEGKKKFPDPAWLADTVAHHLNHRRDPDCRVLVSYGTTRGYIDDVRYVSNYSSGALGSLIAEEFYRCGWITDIVAGPCPINPRTYSLRQDVETNAQMEVACQGAIARGARAAVLAASVLDFAPRERQPGKIASASREELVVSMTRQKKLIAEIRPMVKDRPGPKVGFKLESGLTEDRAQGIARDYGDRYGLSLMVVNDLGDVSASSHKALVFERNAQGHMELLGPFAGKAQLAKVIVRHVLGRGASA